MADKELHQILHGWDDEKIYFYESDPAFKEYCVSDENELMKELIEVCKKYFRGKGNDKRD